MKKKIIYISVLVILFICFLTYKVIYKNHKSNIYSSLVYIESISDDTIKSGSGFVYKIDNNKNYIVTNYHIIEGNKKVYVYNIDKNRIGALVLAYDQYNDIAILIIDDKLDLKKANIGNSAIIKKDEKIFVVGNPSNIDNMGTITRGKIKSISKNLNLELDFNAIEVRAKASYGNSGGPLLNTKGQVIGMMFLKDNSVDDVSFAIPINYILHTSDKLENRPNIGAVMASTSNTKILDKYEIEYSDISGVVILETVQGGLLDKYKLKKGDIIVSFNGKTINNIKELTNELYECSKGDTVKVGYYSDYHYYEIDMQL